MITDFALSDHELAATSCRQALVSDLLCELADFSQAVRTSLSHLNVLSKQDKTPVTEIDFLIQAIFSDIVSSKFSADTILGEEKIDANTLSFLKEKYADFFAYIMEKFRNYPNESTCSFQWIIDPIDGTKGFILNLVYAIGIALVFNNKPVFSAIAACQLDKFFSQLAARPIIATASITQENAQFFYTDKQPVTIELKEDIVLFSREEMSKIPSTVYAHLPYRFLGIDSMAKYVAVGLGLAAGYVRAPVSWQSMIWDHLPGFFLIGQLHGDIVDFNLNAVQFSLEKGIVYLNEGLLVSCTSGWASQLIKIMPQSRLK